MTQLILGEDGKLHAGAVKFSGFIIECDTDTQGVREVKEDEAARLDSGRVCLKCFKRVDDGGTLRCPHCEFVTTSRDEYVAHLVDHYPGQGATAYIIVDVQADFLPGMRLPIRRARNSIR
jgi:hypothetical protein